MKTILSLLVIFLSFGLFSCRESALSDVEVDDPSLLKVYATVWKYSNPDSTVKEVESITVRLTDKTDHSVDLLKGAVYCNGMEMDDETNLLGPYYAIPEVYTNIVADSTYTFVIELADGEQYSGYVTVDVGYLSSLSAPSEWTWTNSSSLTISWNAINNNYTTDLIWYKDYIPGYESDNSIGSVEVDGMTTYTFNADFFTNGSGSRVVEQLKVHLRSYKEGPMDNRFRSGKTTCKFEYVRNIDID